MDSLNKLQCDRNQQFAMITRSEAIVPININCIRADLFVHLEHMNNAQACLAAEFFEGHRKHAERRPRFWLYAGDRISFFQFKNRCSSILLQGISHNHCWI